MSPLSGTAKLYGADPKGLPWQQGIGETYSVSLSIKLWGRPAVSPPSIRETGSVSQWQTAGEIGGRPAVSPPTAGQDRGRPAVSPPAAGQERGRPAVSPQQKSMWKTCSVSTSKVFGRTAESPALEGGNLAWLSVSLAAAHAY